MPVVARLKNGDLLLTGENDERLPTVTNGLISHYPFDGTLNDNLITVVERTDQHPSIGNSEIWNINQPVEGGQVYTISGYFKRSSVHDGRIFCMFALYRADGTIVSGSSSVPGWSSNVVSNEPLYYYFNNDIKSFVSDYGYWSRDIAIPQECNGGKIAWIRFTWAGTPNTTETTSIKLTSFTLKGHTNYASVTNIGTTLTPEGISIESSTANLLQNPSFETGTTANFNTNIQGNGQITVIQTDAADGQHAVRISCTNSQHNWLTQNYNTSIHGMYTASCWIKLERYVSGTIGITLHAVYSDNTYTSAGHTAINYTKIGEWQRISTTVTSDTAKTLSFMRVYAPWSNNLNGSFLGDAIQLELKSHSTTYVNGSRSDNGILEIPQHINSAAQSFSINYWMRPNGYNMLDSNKHIKFNNFGHIWIYYPMGNDQANRRYVWDYQTTDGSRRYGDLIDPVAFNVSKFEMITITWDKDKVRLYRNGIIWGSIAKNEKCTIGIIDKIIFNNPEMTIKDFSIYNKVLSQDDITKLYNSNFQLHSDGDLIDISIEESPNGIPIDAYYFPLSHETNDKNKYYDASDSINLRFDEGAAWVGHGATNLLFDNGIKNWTIGNIGDTTVTVTEVIQNERYRIKRTDSGATQQFRFHVPLSKLINGSTYTLSMKYRMINSTASTPFFTMNDWCDTPVTTTTRDYGNYKFISGTGTRGTYDNIFRFMDFMISTDTEVEVWDIQLEQKIFPTVYSITNTATSHLEYNLNSSIGLDWNGDWSIIYWVMPIGTSLNDLTGYNISSLGVNGNTVGTGYIWWGKDNKLNKITAFSSVGTALEFNSNNYFNKWHMVSLVKSGTMLTIKEYDIDGQISNFSKDLGTIASNYFVNQFGYDLKLGGWGNTSICNSFFKDLIVVKRALSDTEIDTIRNTQMRSYKDKLQIQGKLIEGVNLL